MTKSIAHNLVHDNLVVCINTIMVSVRINIIVIMDGRWREDGMV